MIREIVRFVKKCILQCFSCMICDTRNNPRSILWIRNISKLISITAKVRENYSILYLNNCVQKKCKHQSCMKQQSQISNNKNEIPKAKEPKVRQTSLKPDVPSLVMLLQAVGFHLREFEKQDVVEGENVPRKESIKVMISCGTSQMKAVLEMDGIDCQCPNEAKGGSLWSICGHAPTNNDSGSSFKYEETGSNLLPSIPKGVNNVVRDVVYRLFKIMNNSSSITNAMSGHDLNLSAIGNVENTPNLKKSDSQEGIFRSHTQPNIPSIRVRPTNNKILKSKNLFCSTNNANDTKVSEFAKNETEIRRETLQRQKTWDMDIDIDMRPNSPKVTSTPASVDQLCISLGQISVGSEDESMGFIDYVVKAYRHLDKAVNFLTKKVPVTSSTLSLNEQSFVKPTPPQSVTASASSSPKTTSRPGSACSVPSRLPQKITPVKALNRRSTATPTSRKSTEKPPVPSGGEKSTSLRRQSFNTISGPQKSIPPRLTRGRTASASSINTTTLSDKVLLAKKRPSPDIKSNPLAARKSSIGANTSLRAPVASSKITPQTSTGTLGSKYGFSRNKQA